MIRALRSSDMAPMQTVHRTPALRVISGASREIEADLLIVPVFEDDTLTDEAELDAATGGEVAGSRSRGEFKGKSCEVFVIGLRGWKAPRVALVGIGARKDFSADQLRRAATTGVLAARQRGMRRVAILYRQASPGVVAEAAQAIAEGAVLGNFDGASYKTAQDRPRVFLDAVDLRIAGGSPDVERAVERGRVLGECTNQARELSNEPGNSLPPRIFAERAAALANDAGLAVEVLDEKKIAELKMGLLLGVARGSQEPPRIVVLRHEPKKAAKSPVLGLIGKGITFDTGGISIKPAENMDKMKDDMSGGAAVISAMAAISRLKAPIRVIGIVPKIGRAHV